MSLPVTCASPLLRDLEIAASADLPIPVCSRLVPQIPRWKALRAVLGGKVDATSRAVVDEVSPLVMSSIPAGMSIGLALTVSGVPAAAWAVLLIGQVFLSIAGLTLYLHDCRRAVAFMAVRQALAGCLPEDLRTILATREVEQCNDTRRAIGGLLAPAPPVLPGLAAVFAAKALEDNSSDELTEVL